MTPTTLLITLSLFALSSFLLFGQNIVLAGLGVPHPNFISVMLTILLGGLGYFLYNRFKKN